MWWRVLVFVALAGLSAPPPAAAVDLSQTCVNPELPFAVRFPAGWWVHPVDPSRGIAACEFFGPAPFMVAKNEDGVLDGGVVALRAVDGCVGDFRDVVSRRELTLAGKPTTRIEFADSEGNPTPGSAVNLVYWINVQGQECDATTHYVIASTRSNDAAAYAQNAAILDAMMKTFALGTVPDGAMHRSSTRSPIALAGLLLLVTALLIGFHLWRSRDRLWSS